MILTAELTAYFAGLFDGEGCVSLETRLYKGKRSGFRLRLVVGNTDEQIILDLQRAFGGSIRRVRRPRAEHKDYWVWHVDARKAEAALRQLLPYLRIKRARAELALKYRALVKSTWAARIASESDRDAQQRIALEMNDHNRRGKLIPTK